MFVSIAQSAPQRLGDFHSHFSLSSRDSFCTSPPTHTLSRISSVICQQQGPRLKGRCMCPGAFLGGTGKLLPLPRLAAPLHLQRVTLWKAKLVAHPHWGSEQSQKSLKGILFCICCVGPLERGILLATLQVSPAAGGIPVPEQRPQLPVGLRFIHRIHAQGSTALNSKEKQGR